VDFDGPQNIGKQPYFSLHIQECTAKVLYRVALRKKKSAVVPGDTDRVQPHSKSVCVNQTRSNGEIKIEDTIHIFNQCDTEHSPSAVLYVTWNNH
jgi:hypothetical protein